MIALHCRKLIWVATESLTPRACGSGISVSARTGSAALQPGVAGLPPRLKAHTTGADRTHLLRNCSGRTLPSTGQRSPPNSQLRLGFCVSGAVLGGAGLRASTELPMSTTSARAILHPRYEASYDSTGGKHVSSRGLKGVSPR